MSPAVDELIKQLNEIRIKETHILQQLVEARKREKESHLGLPSNTISVNDRVEITNLLCPTKLKVTTIANRQCKAYRTDAKNARVFLTTNNGIHTWFLIKHLRKID